MPDKVRIIQRKDARFDAYVSELVSKRGYGRERAYAGLADREAAEEVRKKLRAAGRHLGIAVKSFWEPCGTPGRCPAGKGCRYHVRYSAFRLDDARAYKARMAKKASS